MFGLVGGVLLLYLKIEQAELLTAVGGEGDEADGFDLPIDLMADEAQVVILDVKRMDVARGIDALDAVFADEGVGQLEALFHEGIAAGHIVVFAVHVVIEDEADAVDGGILFQRIFDHISLVADPAVLLAAVDAVAHGLGAAGGLQGEGGERSLMPRDIAIVLHQRLLQSAYIHVLHPTAFLQRLRYGGAQRLTEDGAGRHDAGGGKGGVGDADISARKDEIFNILGDHAAQGESPRLGSGVIDGGVSLGVVEALGEVVVHRPARVCHDVVKASLRLHVVLGDGIFAHVAAALPLAGEKADPLQLPIVHAVVAAVLHVVPHAVADLQQLVAAAVGIVDAVPLAAQLDPPEVVGLVVVLIGKILIGLVGIRPGGGREGHRMVGLADLEEAAHAHRLLVCHVGRDALVEVCLRLSAVPIMGARQRRQDRVTRAVGKIGGGDDVEGLGVGLPRLDAHDAVAVHGGVEAGGAQQQGQVFLRLCLFVQHAVPKGVFEGGVLIEVFEEDLLADAALAVVLAVGAADPHSDLAGGVAAQHGTILHQHHLSAVARRRNGTAKPRHAAADHAKLGLICQRSHDMFSFAVWGWMVLL